MYFERKNFKIKYAMYLTSAQAMDVFLQKLDTLLNSISASNKSSFILLDANINLLLKNNQLARNYIEPILSNGFLPIITKATRIHGETFSLTLNRMASRRFR